MKRIIVIFIAVVLLVASFGYVLFRNPSYDLDTLSKKFNACYIEIEAIANGNNLEDRFWVTDEANSLKKYHISVNDTSNIYIEFSTNATETQKGMGYFSVSYTISDIGDENSFDVELFTELVNSISGKTITADFVTEFLTAPEEKYSVQKYGLSGDGYAVEKMHALDFLEDRVIGYNLTYDNHADLWFYGRVR